MPPDSHTASKVLEALVVGYSVGYKPSDIMTALEQTADCLGVELTSEQKIHLSSVLSRYPQPREQQDTQHTITAPSQFAATYLTPKDLFIHLYVSCYELSQMSSAASKPRARIVNAAAAASWDANKGRHAVFAAATEELLSKLNSAAEAKGRVLHPSEVTVILNSHKLPDGKLLMPALKAYVTAQLSNQAEPALAAPTVAVRSVEIQAEEVIITELVEQYAQQEHLLDINDEQVDVLAAAKPKEKKAAVPLLGEPVAQVLTSDKASKKSKKQTTSEQPAAAREPDTTEPQQQASKKKHKKHRAQQEQQQPAAAQATPVASKEAAPPEPVEEHRTKQAKKHHKHAALAHAEADMAAVVPVSIKQTTGNPAARSRTELGLDDQLQLDENADVKKKKKSKHADVVGDVHVPDAPDKDGKKKKRKHDVAGLAADQAVNAIAYGEEKKKKKKKRHKEGGNGTGVAEQGQEGWNGVFGVGHDQAKKQKKEKKDKLRSNGDDDRVADHDEPHMAKKNRSKEQSHRDKVTHDKKHKKHHKDMAD